MLSATGYKVQGRQTVDLSWSGATSGSVDIYRNGAFIGTASGNSGFYTDAIGAKGHATYTYTACEHGTQTCSNQATVTF
jgi:serine protease